MALPPGRPLADPLLEPDAGPRDASGEVVRAPVGNSGRTLAVFLLLALVGVAVWWMRRPSDLTDRLAGTEWIVVEAGGAPHVNADGQVSAFALGHRSMLRTGGPCGVAAGSWSFDVSEQSLEIGWEAGAPEGCANENGEWTVAVPSDGGVDLDGDELRLGEPGRLRAFLVTDRPAAEADDLAGRWGAGGHLIEIGPRGLFRVGDCMGAWDDVPTGIRWSFESTAPGCDLGPVWGGGDTFVPLRFEDSLYLWRVAPGSAFDPFVLRLEPVADSGSPLLGSP